MVKEEEFEFFQLANGLRIVHKQVNSQVSHAGIIIGVGTRHEQSNEHGMAHFIEHCIFKGTEKRKAFHIISRLEDVGGDLNAYTAREETFVYASFLPEHYERSLDLFADILFHSTFPDKEVEKEKLVVLEEINSYRDNPYEMIYDQFDELVFRGHPLGRNILGNEKSIRSFQPADLHAFTNRLYLPENMVLCSVGKIDGKSLFQLASKIFSGYSAGNRSQEAGISPLEYQHRLYQPFQKKVKKRTFQTHSIYGCLAYSLKDTRRLAFSFLTNLLGGPAMSSRLNMSLREKNGLAYQVEATYSPFQETGLFSVYLGTDLEKQEQAMELLQKELARIKTEKVGPVQFRKARQQYIGQIAISLESNINQLISIGKSYQVFDKVDSYREIVRKIEAVTEHDLLEAANEVFYDGAFSELAYLSR